MMITLQEKVEGRTPMGAPIVLEKQEVKRLIALMRDPRYWRDHDPQIVREVRSGFKQLYQRHASGEPEHHTERTRSAA
jgi:hypothetical protein